MKTILVQISLLAIWSFVGPTTSQGPPLANFQAALPGQFYPAPPPGQFQYLYTPVVTTQGNNGVTTSPVNRNQQKVVVRVDNQKKRRNQKKNQRRQQLNMRNVNYTYIPIELLSALLNNDVRTRPVDPMPIVPTSGNDVQLGSGVFIRVPLRFRNSSSLDTDLTPPEEVEDENLEAIADNEIIPMEMFEEMLEMDMRRRFNTTSPVFNSQNGVRVTLNNLLRLFAPPASLLRRAGTNTFQQENLFMRLLRDRYQLQGGIFNANTNNI